MSAGRATAYSASDLRAFRIQMVVAFLSTVAIAGTRPTTTYRALDLGATNFEVGLVQSAFSVLPALTAVSDDVFIADQRRVIQQDIEDVLSEKILFKDFRAGQTIVIDCVTTDDVQELTFEAVEGLPPSVDFDATPSA